MSNCRSKQVVDNWTHKRRHRYIKSSTYDPCSCAMNTARSYVPTFRKNRCSPVTKRPSRSKKNPHSHTHICTAECMQRMKQKKCKANYSKCKLKVIKIYVWNSSQHTAMLQMINTHYTVQIHKIYVCMNLMHWVMIVFVNVRRLILVFFLAERCNYITIVSLLS